MKTFNREFIDGRIDNLLCHAAPVLMADGRKRADNSEYPSRVDEIRNFVEERRSFILGEYLDDDLKQRVFYEASMDIGDRVTLDKSPSANREGEYSVDPPVILLFWNGEKVRYGRAVTKTGSSDSGGGGAPSREAG